MPVSDGILKPFWQCKTHSISCRNPVSGLQANLPVCKNNEKQHRQRVVQVAERASIGKGPGYKCFAKFVEYHSGGAEIKCLKRLEIVERRLDPKRVTHPTDWKKIGEIVITGGDRSPLMMIMAAMVPYVENGVVEMFTTSDYSSLAAPHGEHRVHVVESPIFL